MKHFLLVITILSASIVANANPCFVVTPDFGPAFKSAKAVFIGEVVKITKPDELATSPIRSQMHTVTFKVEYSWKGAGFQEIGIPDLVVLSPQAMGFCDSGQILIEGRKYLVYANETPDGDLIVGYSNRTAYIGNATEDLKQLRRLERFGSRPSIPIFLDDHIILEKGEYCCVFSPQP